MLRLLELLDFCTFGLLDIWTSGFIDVRSLPRYKRLHLFNARSWLRIWLEPVKSTWKTKMTSGISSLQNVTVQFWKFMLHSQRINAAISLQVNICTWLVIADQHSGASEFFTTCVLLLTSAVPSTARSSRAASSSAQSLESPVPIGGILRLVITI